MALCLHNLVISFILIFICEGAKGIRTLYLFFFVAMEGHWKCAKIVQYQSISLLFKLCWQVLYIFYNKTSTKKNKKKLRCVIRHRHHSTPVRTQYAITCYPRCSIATEWKRGTSWLGVWCSVSLRLQCLMCAKGFLFIWSFFFFFSVALRAWQWGEQLFWQPRVPCSWR